VAVDGKTLRRSVDWASERAAIHRVSAWAATLGTCLGPLKTVDKENETTVIPLLLKRAGAVVTLDAMGCHKTTTVAIREGGADDVIAVKDNPPTLYQSIKAWSDESAALPEHESPLVSFTTTESDHGREEQRTAWVGSVPEDLPNPEKGVGLRSLGCVESARILNGKTSLCQHFTRG
jgi:predicted transposase YbfD/YdcC